MMSRLATAALIVLVGFVWMGGPALSRAQSPGSGNGSGAGSEAVIQQVASTEATSQLSETTGIAETKLVWDLLGNGEEGELGLGSLLDERPSDGQAVFVRQRGSSNAATINQQGASNYAAVVQLGRANVTTVTQRGRRNAAGILLDGNQNEIRLLQEGTDNAYLLGFQGNDLDLTGERMRVQKGSNNRLVELGRNSIPFNVRQTGDGMSMIIRHYGGGQ